MARKKKSESIDELVKATPEVEQVDQKESTETAIQENAEQPAEEQKEQQPVAEVNSEEIEEVKEVSKEVTNQESDPNTTVESISEEINDSDVEEIENSTSVEIPQELLEEQEKVQKEADKLVQEQKEKNQKPDLDRDTVSFEDFQKEIENSTNGTKDLKPYLIPLSKDSKCKYSVGLQTKAGHTRIIAHKLSKEKAEKYIENFLKVNK